MAPDKIKILYVIGSMGNGRAGTEKSLLTLIDNLDRSRFEPVLVSLQDCEFMRSGKFSCEAHCWHTYRLFTPHMFRRENALATFIRDHQFDLIQTFFVEGHLVGGMAAKQAGVRAIISSRRNLGYSYTAKIRIILKVANRYPLRYLANSHAVVDSISRIEKIDRSQFDVIFNGVELKPPSPWDERSPLKVAMISNLRAVKAIPTLIRAASKVVEDYPAIKFRIVGEGPDRMALQSMIADSGLARNFEMPGSTVDVHAAIAKASIGVLTSSSEGFSNSLLEYMRAELPVIATRIGGNTEVVEEGKNGYLIEINDPETLAQRLIQLLQNPDTARVMGAHGRKLVEQKFSLNTMVKNHQDYYARVIEQTHR